LHTIAPIMPPLSHSPRLGLIEDLFKHNQPVTPKAESFDLPEVSLETATMGYVLIYIELIYKPFPGVAIRRWKQER
jgi:hypothetical protein